ncbi:hypothetical protein Tco_0507825, partial [Tanacetum coccineum]
NAAERLLLLQEFLLSEVKDCLENKDTYEDNLETGQNGDVLLRTPRITTPGLQDLVSSLVFCSWDFLGLP